MKISLKHITVLLVLFCINSASVFSSEIELKGQWKFKIGDDKNWASPAYDDVGWKTIKAPLRWEDQGFRGYDGFAWYRKTFRIDNVFKGHVLMLELGYVDDVDEVFFNGVKIGQSGSFPPFSSTAYNAKRQYTIPSGLVRFGGENLIAVRVYDSQLSGGIVGGNLRIYSTGMSLDLDVDLSGKWNLNRGRETNLENAKPIIVPGMWENQGFDYDGYAVYSRTFICPEELTTHRVVLLAGRIDDLDRVYINGQYVGSTGKYFERICENNHLAFRNYFIPPGILNAGENFIEIKVYDEAYDGGIVEGTVGIVTQDKFRAYWKAKRKK